MRNECGCPLRVLVVDDEPAIRRFLHTSLKTEGYEVLEEETGEGALAEIRRREPDLVMLDLGLPGIDGLDMIFDLAPKTVADSPGFESLPASSRLEPPSIAAL